MPTTYKPLDFIPVIGAVLNYRRNEREWRRTFEEECKRKHWNWNSDQREILHYTFNTPRIDGMILYNSLILIGALSAATILL